MLDQDGLFDVLESGRVTRFHAVPGVSSQEISSHSWGVMMFVLYINPEASRNLLIAASLHDCAEIWTGDVPFHVKKHGDPAIKEALDKEEDRWFSERSIDIPILIDSEKFLLKISDCFEGMQHCSNCLAMGQEKALTPFREWLQITAKMIDSVVGISQGSLKKVKKLYMHYDNLFDHYFRKACNS